MRQSLRNFSRVFLSPEEVKGFCACDFALAQFIMVGFEFGPVGLFRL